MRSKLLLLLVALLATSASYAQNYNVNQSTGTSAPFVWNQATGTADVLNITSDQVLSAWQTLPFTWNFYGQPVTGYYVSDNGYITFDQSATVSDEANTTIPNAAGPNNAIYAFWDNWGVTAGTGTPDRVFTYTYGTAPNRVHVIAYYSVTVLGGSGFGYPTIRIYESEDFDVVLSYGNTTGTSGTIGAEDATGAAGVQVAGSPTVSFPVVGSGAADDVVYSFSWDQIFYDMSVTELDYENAITVGNQNITGTIKNKGSMAVTSFDLHYTSNGGATQTMNVTGVNIASGADYAFSHSTILNVATGGQTYDICVWADNINGNADQRPNNDQLCKSLFSNTGTSGTRTVLIEEFTGAWCGWCPDGEVVVDQIIANNPGKVLSVSVHDGDGMEFNDGIRTGFAVSAYPNGMVDRKLFAGETKEPHSRGAWAANAAAQIGSYTPADVKITYTYNATLRKFDITFTADFVDFATGDLRFVPMIVEDNVTGSGSAYDQVNYLNGTAGHPYGSSGDPIVGFVHKRVLRALPGGAFGNAGVIPSQVSAGDSHSENFVYVLPGGYDRDEVSIIGALVYYSGTVGQREVINSTETVWPVKATEVPSVVGQMTVFPNPTNQRFSLDFDLDEAVTAEIVIFDMFGRRVAVLENRDFQAGNHIISHDVSSLASGSYFVSILTDKNKAYSRRLVIVK
jgi:hypothetical protein